MSLDVWFKDDIRNTLLALNETSRDTHALARSVAGESESTAHYRSGYADALRAVAIAFGIAVPRITDAQPGGSFPAAADLLPARNGTRTLEERDGRRT